MRVDLELADLLELLATMASDAKDDARIEFPGTKADAVIFGISFLHEYQRITLSDAEDFDFSPETKAQTLNKAISLFCHKNCTHSRKQPPGSADACPTCPLMPFTVGAVEKAVERATAPEPQQPQGVRHGYDPRDVAAARAKLDADMKAGRG